MARGGSGVVFRCATECPGTLTLDTGA
jgi:hypothetical protein